VAIRKDQSSLTDDEKATFVDAILALKQAPSMLHPGSPTASRYDDYVELHVKAMMAMPEGWAHQGPAFFPWHRVLLIHLERDLQQVTGDPTLSIPYWDWIEKPEFPSFLGGDGDPDHGFDVVDGPFGRDKWIFNVVDSPGMARHLQRRFGFGDLDEAGNPAKMDLPSAAAQDTALKIRWYDAVPWDATSPSASSFREVAEVDLHNQVHRWVGGFWTSDGALATGTMMQMTSPNDPVFWLHHCNLDRLWAAWQTLHPRSAPFLPQGGAAPGHNLRDMLLFGDPMPWVETYTAATVIDTYALGYSYDSLQQLAGTPTPTAFAARMAAMTPTKRDPRKLFPLRSES
jgi:tyrosinase